MSSATDKLKEVWMANGYPSGGKLWQILKHMDIHNNYIRKNVDEFVAAQKTSQLHHRPVKAAHSYISAAAPGIMYVCDLLDMSAYARDNGGNKWLLICMDIFSRKSSNIIPMKNKTAAEARDALLTAFESIDAKMPKVLMSDLGSEFKGATAKMLEDNNIIHRTAEVGDHHRLGIIDRFSGVVKNWIAKHMTHKQTKSYVNILPALIEKYNDAPHSSLAGMTPNEAWKYPAEARDIHYEKVQKAMIKSSKKSKLQVGTWVRVLKLKGVFDKGYHVKYSLTPHKIVEIKGLNYTLDNGKFYRANRLLAIPEDENNEPVKDVAKKARQERKRDLVLQQEGIDPIANPEIRRSARLRKPEHQLISSRGEAIKY